MILETLVMQVMAILDSLVVAEAVAAVVVPFMKVKNQVLIVPTVEIKAKTVHNLVDKAVLQVLEAIQLNLVETKNLMTDIPKEQTQATLVPMDKAVLQAIKVMATQEAREMKVRREILDKKLNLVIINSLVDKVGMVVTETQATLETLVLRVMVDKEEIRDKAEMADL